MLKIRNALKEESKKFSELIITSAMYFHLLFSEKIETALQNFFYDCCNLFSYRHVLTAEYNGEVAGMILGYGFPDKKKENLRTGFLMFKYLGWVMLEKFPVLLRFNGSVGALRKGEFYISNVAVYKRFRGLGIGKALMNKAESRAKMSGADYAVLDVEAENNVAINLYKKLGYRAVKSATILLTKNRILRFLRMKKPLL